MLGGWNRVVLSPPPSPSPLPLGVTPGLRMAAPAGVCPAPGCTWAPGGRIAPYSGSFDKHWKLQRWRQTLRGAWRSPDRAPALTAWTVTVQRLERFDWKMQGAEAALPGGGDS